MPVSPSSHPQALCFPRYCGQSRAQYCGHQRHRHACHRPYHTIICAVAIPPKPRVPAKLPPKTPASVGGFLTAVIVVTIFVVTIATALASKAHHSLQLGGSSEASLFRHNVQVRRRRICSPVCSSETKVIPHPAAIGDSDCCAFDPNGSTNS